MRTRWGYTAATIALAVAASACVAAPGAVPLDTSPSLAPSQGPASTSGPTTDPAASSGPTTAPSLSSSQFWAMLVSGDPAAVSYSSVKELAQASDAVVLASFQDVVAGPDYNDQFGNTTYNATISLRVDRVLHGSLQSISGTVPLDVFLGAGPAGALQNPYGDLIAQMKSSMPAERGVFFLVNMATWYRQFTDQPTSYDPSLYQVVSGQGLLRDANGVTAIHPNAPGTWPRLLNGKPFVAAVAEIAEAGAIP